MSARLVFTYDDGTEATLSPYEVRQYQGDEAGLPDYLERIGWASLGKVQNVPNGDYGAREVTIVGYRVEVLAWTGDYVPTRRGTSLWRKGQHVISRREKWDGREWQLLGTRTGVKCYDHDHTPTHVTNDTHEDLTATSVDVVV